MEILLRKISGTSIELNKDDPSQYFSTVLQNLFKNLSQKDFWKASELRPLLLVITVITLFGISLPHRK